MTGVRKVWMLSLLVMTLLACNIGTPGSVMTASKQPKTPTVMTSTPVPMYVSARVTAIRSLNIRKFYGHDSPAIGALYHDNTVVMTGKCSDDPAGWAEIVWKDGTAWVNADFLSKNKCSEEQ